MCVKARRLTLLDVVYPSSYLNETGGGLGREGEGGRERMVDGGVGEKN